MSDFNLSEGKSGCPSGYPKGPVKFWSPCKCSDFTPRLTHRLFDFRPVTVKIITCIKCGRHDPRHSGEK